MAKNKEKNPVVLQILPELNQGGVELGTIEIASELQKKAFKTLWLPRADVWLISWIV
ncbi:MAG: hypothetical protein IKR60_03795 [Alphaproteobacteria bacterium]|nr:hypothetical protein [Alphaproteobacteria bacterium]